MDYGLISDETYPEADYLKKSMYGFGFWDKTNKFCCLGFINGKVLLDHKPCREKTATSQWWTVCFIGVFFFSLPTVRCRCLPMERGQFAVTFLTHNSFLWVEIFYLIVGQYFVLGLNLWWSYPEPEYLLRKLNTDLASEIDHYEDKDFYFFLFFF